MSDGKANLFDMAKDGTHGEDPCHSDLPSPSVPHLALS